MRGFFVCPQMFNITKFIYIWLRKAVITAIIVILALNISIQETAAAWEIKDIINAINTKQNMVNFFVVTGTDSVVAVGEPETPKTMKVTVTGYSSTPEETDDTPFITASNSMVHDGVAAANFLEFGTKIKIPSIYGDKVFTIEDRMAKKHSDKIDIWFPEKQLAKKFGKQQLEVQILE